MRNIGVPETALAQPEKATLPPYRKEDVHGWPASRFGPLPLA